MFVVIFNEVIQSTLQHLNAAKSPPPPSFFIFISYLYQVGLREVRLTHWDELQHLWRDLACIQYPGQSFQEIQQSSLFDTWCKELNSDIISHDNTTSLHTKDLSVHVLEKHVGQQLHRKTLFSGQLKNKDLPQLKFLDMIFKTITNHLVIKFFYKALNFEHFCISLYRALHLKEINIIQPKKGQVIQPS